MAYIERGFAIPETRFMAKGRYLNDEEKSEKKKISVNAYTYWKNTHEKNNEV